MFTLIWGFSITFHTDQRPRELIQTGKSILQFRRGRHRSCCTGMSSPDCRWNAWRGMSSRTLQIRTRSNGMFFITWSFLHVCIECNRSFRRFHASVYFAIFPSNFLAQNRDIDITPLGNPKCPLRVCLRRTKQYNLMNPTNRLAFIREFVALLRFIAAGRRILDFWGSGGWRFIVLTMTLVSMASKIAYKTILHVNEDEIPPPQEEMEEEEEERWRKEHAAEYANWTCWLHFWAGFCN